MRTLFWNDQGTIDLLEKELRQGNVILGDCDTVLGLLADVSQQGFNHLDHSKHRSKKPYLVLVHDSNKVFNYIHVSKSRLFQIEKLMTMCWPGPVTLIFMAKNDLPHYMKSSDGTIALRVPRHNGLQQLLKRFDGLFSTSANVSGAPIPSDIAHVDERIMNSVACIVLNNMHDNAQLRIIPSTIIDCTGEQLIVVRQGALSVDKLVKEFNEMV